MAICIRGATRCSLCDQVITEDDDVVMTSHFIPDQAHPLWRYSDSTMHRRCFLGWEHRGEFVAMFNTIHSAQAGSHRGYKHMLADGDIQVREPDSVTV